MALVAMVRTRLTTGGAPEPVVHDTAASLRALGHEVVLLAWDRDARHPLRSATEWGRIERYRRACPLNDARAFATALPRFYLWTLRRLLTLRRAPLVLHFHDLDTLPLGVAAARLLRRPLVYDCHENYPALVRGAVSDDVAQRLHRLEARLLRSCDGVLAAGPQGYARLGAMLRDGQGAPFAATLEQALAVLRRPDGDFRRGRLTLLGNLKRLEVFDAPGDAPRKLPDGFRLLYIGVLERHPSRGILETALAVERMAGVHFIVGGFGTLAPRLERLVRRLRHTLFLGPVNPGDIPALTKAADAVLLALDPANLNNRLSVPNKLFEAMAAGIPVIACHELLAGQLVEAEGCGVTFAWGDWRGLRAVVARLRDDPQARQAMGRRGRALAESRFNWGVCEERLGALYGRVMGAPPGAKR